MDDYMREHILHMVLAAWMAAIALGLFCELRASSAGFKTLIKEAADTLAEHFCGTITSCEGEFLVVDKYTETKGLLFKGTIYKAVLEDLSQTRYIVRVSEKDYANLDVQEQIFAEFQSYEKLTLCEGFHILEE